MTTGRWFWFSTWTPWLQSWARDHTGEGAADQVSTPFKARARVLVAEDSLVVRSLLRRQLEDSGYAVVEAVDGEEALRLCRERQPDVVLLDVEMPKLDGYGVLTAIRKEPDLAEIPVVFLTARATTEDVVEGLRLGAHDYLRKPFEPAELLARVSAALRVKVLQDQLRAMSRTDPLTGLANRRRLQDHLLAVCSAAERHGQSVGVLMVDVDHFKAVNDTLGHDSGDVVLRAVASRLADACRLEDVAGRWGGEEFLVVAPLTDHVGVAELGERVRKFVADGPVTIDGGSPVEVTVSVGGAAGSGDADALLRVADASLYEAKRTGRNRVVTADVTNAS
jgi:diguanylate cyclase (GGDEF)-like protein